MAKKRKYGKPRPHSGPSDRSREPAPDAADSEDDPASAGDPFRGDHEAAVARADALAVDLEQTEAEVERLRSENVDLKTRADEESAAKQRTTAREAKRAAKRYKLSDDEAFDQAAQGVKPASWLAKPVPPARTKARKQRPRPEGDAKPKPKPKPKRPMAEPPAFWFGFEVSWAKLAIGRVVVFMLLACDALLAISHAPRYGAGGFNVAQIIGLDGYGPTRASYAIGQLVLAYLFVFAACGIATRLVMPCAAVIYSWLYFGSQLDSYQHHYLVALILVIASFVPWQRPVRATPDTPVRSWALRLLLVQLAILYGWAAISKMDHAWLDGRALSLQILPTPTKLFDLRAMIDATIGMTAVAKLVLVTELGLALTIWMRPAWRFVAPIGILFHFGIVLTGFDIGLFAWLMIALYIFVVPDRVWIALAGSPPGRAVRAIAGGSSRSIGPIGQWVAWSACLTIGIVIAVSVRFDYAPTIGALLIILAIGIAALGRRDRQAHHGRIVWIGLAHLLAMTTWLAIDRGSTVANDYYRFWGGSSRRLGDTAAAEHAYRRLTEVAPDEPSGHFQLGKILIDKDDSVAGLAALHEAQRLEPGRARAYIAEARWLARHGRPAEAIAKAREGTYAEPSNAEARTLLDGLTGTKPGGAGSAAGAGPEADDP